MTTPTPTHPFFLPFAAGAAPTHTVGPLLRRRGPPPRRASRARGRRVGTQGRHARACAVSVAGAQEAAVAAEAAAGQSVVPRPGPDPKPPLTPSRR
jgi:hypothetical protein